MTDTALLSTSIPGTEPSARGKVRDIYDLGDELLLVATDRISAFDWILPNGIPDKGKILTRISTFWFEQMSDLAKNHIVATDVDSFPEPFKSHADQFADRSMLVRKCEMFEVEFVIRGYLAGSGWKEYRQHGTVCDIPLPDGLLESSRLPEPLYTPATKATEGHDINIHPERAAEIVGADWNAKAVEQATAIYNRGHEFAASCGLILCDTKFEFGILDNELVLADEILTPDSSRYWPSDQYEPGHGQPSYDKQFVRDWLESTDWDKNSPPPALPDAIVEKTREKYLEAYRVLTGDTEFLA